MSIKKYFQSLNILIGGLGSFIFRALVVLAFAQFECYFKQRLSNERLHLKDSRLERCKPMDFLESLLDAHSEFLSFSIISNM